MGLSNKKFDEKERSFIKISNRIRIKPTKKVDKMKNQEKENMIYLIDGIKHLKNIDFFRIENNYLIGTISTLLLKLK